jgi:hypothetical protein
MAQVSLTKMELSFIIIEMEQNVQLKQITPLARELSISIRNKCENAKAKLR